MEVVVLGTDGIPQDSILSIRAGATRRQCVVSGVDKPFRFPISPEAAGTVKIDVLSVTGSVRALCDKGERDYALNLKKATTPLPSVADATGKISLKIRPVPPSSVKEPSLPLPEETYARSDARNSAETYLQENNIMSLLQVILQSIIKERPSDPYAFIAHQFGHEPASLKTDRLVKEETQETVVTDPRQSGATTQVSQAGQRQAVAEAETIQDLRFRAWQVLDQSAVAGSLLDALQKPQGKNPEAIPDLKRQALQVLVQSAEAGSLLDALHTQNDMNAETIQDLRLEVQQVPAKGVDTGILAEALAKRDDEPAVKTSAPQEAQGSSADLRVQAREVLVNCAASGVLGVGLRRSQMASGELDRKMLARNALANSAENGNLLATIELAPSQATVVGDVGVQGLRRQVREALMSGAKNGSLMDVLVETRPCDDDANDKTDLRLRARDTLAKGALSGSLRSMLSTLKPGGPAQAEELADLRKRARDVLAAGAESGAFAGVLRSEWCLANVPCRLGPVPQPSDATASASSREEVGDFKRQAFQVLAAAAERSELTNVLEQARQRCQQAGPAPVTKAVAAEPDPELVHLKRKACQVLTKSTQNGDLSRIIARRLAAVSSPRAELKDVKRDALQVLAKSAENGSLFQALAQRPAGGATNGSPKNDAFKLREGGAPAPESPSQQAFTIIKGDGDLATAVKFMTTQEFRVFRSEAA